MSLHLPYGWHRVATSGYVAYFDTPDATERYFAVYYDNDDDQIVVTLKRAGLSGLSAQIRFECSNQIGILLPGSAPL